MEREGVAVVETAVGDRYVLEAMREGGYSLGGEQSGHVVLADHATTGDGVLTALHLLARVAGTGRTLADLAAVMERLPQVLVNVRDVDKGRAGTDEVLAARLAAAEAELAGHGPGAAAPLRHRAARAGDGRGADRRVRPGRGRGPRRRRPRAARPALTRTLRTA